MLRCPRKKADAPHFHNLPEREKAARQQGSLSFRENSSNGGKPSELSGAILWAGAGGVKAKSGIAATR
jgi:hypothetical protein